MIGIALHAGVNSSGLLATISPATSPMFNVV